MLKTMGHAFLGVMFVVGGSSSFAQPGGRVVKVADAGIPKAREATILNGLVMTVAGLTLMLGIAPKLSSALLAGSLAATTYVGHPYWKEENPANRVNQRTQFLKNLAMLGGLLVVLTEK